MFLVSDSRPPAFAAPVAAERSAPTCSRWVRPGAKAMAVLRGDADAYLHAGGQWEWDSAAPVGVALAAGLHATRVDGSPLAYNATHPYLPDLVICRAELAEAAADRHRRPRRVRDSIRPDRVGPVAAASTKGAQISAA